MFIAEFITFSVFMTMACWLLAVVVESLAENKTHYRITLCLIFWPIGLAVLIVMGFMKLFKTAFGKE